MVRLYHGTTTKFLRNIRKHGLLPPEQSGKSAEIESDPGAYKEDEFQRVCLARNPGDAYAYANRAADVFGGIPVVMVVDVPEEWLVEDEPGFSFDLLDYERAWVRKHKLSGIRSRGSVACLRTVPPQFIKSYIRRRP